MSADERFDSRSFSEGWCPGATAIANSSGEQEQSKKCDKQLTHIVRVMGRLLFKDNLNHVVYFSYTNPISISIHSCKN